MKAIPVVAAALLAPALSISPVLAQKKGADMTFFVTSVGKGNGADLGGLEGADAHCNALAAAAGSKRTTWKAYLSTTAPGGEAGVNARERIGKGPWKNAKGVVVAKNVADLHSAKSNVTKQTALTEKGEMVKGRGDTPNEHDILTGSQMDGTAYPAGDKDQTCGNWTKSDDDQTGARVAHFDRIGIADTPEQKSWSSSHTSPGCSMAALRKVGGAGLLYCFAAN